MSWMTERQRGSDITSIEGGDITWVPALTQKAIDVLGDVAYKAFEQDVNTPVPNIERADDTIREEDAPTNMEVEMTRATSNAKGYDLNGEISIVLSNAKDIVAKWREKGDSKNDATKSDSKGKASEGKSLKNVLKEITNLADLRLYVPIATPLELLLIAKIIRKWVVANMIVLDYDVLTNIMQFTQRNKASIRAAEMAIKEKLNILQDHTLELGWQGVIHYVVKNIPLGWLFDNQNS